MTETALDSSQQAPDLVVASWDLDADDLVVFLGGAVGLAVGVVVDVPGDFLGKTVALVAELVVAAVDLVWVLAEGALPGVHLKVVGCPALGRVHGTRDRAHGILLEAHYSVLLEGGNLLGLDDSGHAVLAREGRHLGGGVGVCENGA